MGIFLEKAVRCESCGFRCRHRRRRTEVGWLEVLLSVLLSASYGKYYDDQRDHANAEDTTNSATNDGRKLNARE